MLKKILIGLVVVLVLLQFVPMDKTNPVADPAKDFLAVHQTSPEISTIIKNSCYDCHSHQTEYPWYSNVAPVNFFIKNHILEARKHLNFSLWSEYSDKKRDHKLEECSEAISEGEMPLKSFIWMHPEARLSDDQKALLADYFKSLRGNTPMEGDTDEH